MTKADAPEPERESEVLAGTTSGTVRAEAKAITIMLPDDTLKKLKVVAVLKDTTVSELLTEAAALVLRRDLKKALAKVAVE